MSEPAAAHHAARQAAEAAARQSHGRLLAILAARTRDLTAAEDALAGAFATALRVWPDRGVPDTPAAWLLTTARRTLAHAARHSAVRQRARQVIEMLHDETADCPDSGFPDERLKLLFVCAHPAIDQAVRTPLMLQTVLGLDADRIGAAFLVPGPTMGQRLVRAKAKVRDAGIPFAEPDPAALPDRLSDVLAAIYAAFTAGWDDNPGGDPARSDLGGEAIYLAELVVGQMPSEPEPRGLLALMLYCAARGPARRGPDGCFVPLSQQDARLWSRPMIRRAETLLTDAAALARPGRFQTEAAIQSVHVQCGVTGRTNGAALMALYDVLVTQTGSIGARIARAIACADHADPDTALAQLDALPADRTAAHQPFWVARAHVLALRGDAAGAQAARNRAVALTRDPAIRRFLVAGGGQR